MILIRRLSGMAKQSRASVEGFLLISVKYELVAVHGHVLCTKHSHFLTGTGTSFNPAKSEESCKW